MDTIEDDVLLELQSKKPIPFNNIFKCREDYHTINNPAAFQCLSASKFIMGGSDGIFRIDDNGSEECLFRSGKYSKFNKAKDHNQISNLFFKNENSIFFTYENPKKFYHFKNFKKIEINDYFYSIIM